MGRVQMTRGTGGRAPEMQSSSLRGTWGGRPPWSAMATSRVSRPAHAISISRAYVSHCPSGGAVPCACGASPCAGLIVGYCRGPQQLHGAADATHEGCAYGERTCYCAGRVLYTQQPLRLRLVHHLAAPKRVSGPALPSSGLGQQPHHARQRLRPPTVNTQRPCVPDLFNYIIVVQRHDKM